MKRIYPSVLGDDESSRYWFIIYASMRTKQGDCYIDCIDIYREFDKIDTYPAFSRFYYSGTSYMLGTFKVDSSCRTYSFTEVAKWN